MALGQQRLVEIVIKATNQASKVLGQVSRDADSFMRRHQRAFDAVRKASIAAGAATAAGLTLSIKAAADFDTQLRNIQSISKDTDEAIQEMGRRFIELSKQLPQSATTLAEGFYNIQSSGFAGADAMQVLEAAAKAASAGLTTTEVSAKVLTAALNAYGLGAEKAREVSDILFKTVDIGVVEFDELASTIGDVLATAAAAGVSLDQLGAAIATMTKGGIGAAEATTALNATILAFIKPSKEMQAQLASLGFESGIAALESEGLQGILTKLNEAVEGDTSAMQALFPNVRALRGALSLTREEGRVFAEDLKAISSAAEGAGATQAAFAEQSKAFSFQMRILRNNIEAVAITLGTALLPVLNNLIKRITPVVAAFARFVELHPMIVAAIMGIVMALGALSALSFAILPIIAVFKMVGEIIIAVVTPAIAILAAKIILITAIIAGLYLAWQTNFLGIRDIVMSVVEAIVGFLTFLWENIVLIFTQILSFVIPILQQVFTHFSTIFNAIFTVVSWVMQQIFVLIQFQLLSIWVVIQLVLALIFAIWQGIWSLFEPFLSAVWASIKWLVSAGVEFVKSLIDAGLSWIQQKWEGSWQDMWEFVVEIWEKIKTSVSNAIEEVKNLLRGFVSAVEMILRSIRVPSLHISLEEKEIFGFKIKVPKLAWFKHGGFVPEDMLAYLHKGEFVLSRDMLAGRKPVPPQVNYNYNYPAVNVGPVYIQDRLDAETLGQRLAFYLRTDGRF